MRVKASCVVAVLALTGLVAGLVSIDPAAAQQDYRMSIVNGTSTPIEFFHYSECSANNWLGDRLGSNEVINPGGRRVFDMYDGIRDCCRDMRAKFSNGTTRERMSVNVCRESEWVVR
ncbi:MAG: hypothetical protein K2X43_08905 [Hyphomonadaceae bacterium]|jgi:hypothetical protein|nr:hypothetical protein [Hyphomonadaceae bacterium]